MATNSNNSSPGHSPSSTTLEAVDYDLQFPTWSMEYLKKAAMQQRLVRPRSLAWAIMLNAIPPPSGDILLSIHGHRNFYNDLRNKLSMDPRAVIGDDPLSQNDESAWKQHFCDNELKALILQDVVRTFPDETYFRDKDVQDTMVRVLFFWSRAHPSPGYRQGMHEVLAPLLFELHCDRQKAKQHTLSDTLLNYLEEDYLEHDSYMLFSAVMKGLEQFYSTGDIIPTSCGRLPLSRSLHNQNEAVRYLERVREEYLTSADPELAKHLMECNISMELFGIRWLRLLFGREFPRTEIPNLWSFIFSDGPMLPNLHHIVVAMLMSIRTALLECDTGGALSLLMRPSSASAGHVCALSLHLRDPVRYPSPPAQLNNSHDSAIDAANSEYSYYEKAEDEAETDGSEGLAEGGDVARSLAALALLRARLPAAVAALQAALPRPPPDAIPALEQIAQLSALLQCRNHDLIDVETALEAAENQTLFSVGRRQLVPVMLGRNKPKVNQVKVNQAKVNQVKVINKVKEVPLQVFHQVECDSTSDLPFQDPLRLRTE
ncbi:TBC1 domain family member 5 isoform X2 [Pieris rapae]|uniref:TBC1 domain family member 5 isoform X2 n=1 Tax=Pieris rapae TaxID=64459 RepID=UPI001E280CF8|nr:TBC1 domain family member 5 isoform X2 [Pieris rapae]